MSLTDAAGHRVVASGLGNGTGRRSPVRTQRADVAATHINPPYGDRVWLLLVLSQKDGWYVDSLRATSLIITG